VTDRFYYSTNEEIRKLAVKSVPKKTQNTTKWVITTFNSWLENRNKFSSEKCPTDILDQQNPVLSNYWLKIFAVEVRKVNGDPYPLENTLFDV